MQAEIEALEAAARAQDAEEFDRQAQAVWHASEFAAPAEISAGVVEIARLIDELSTGAACGVALLAGALVERGAPPQELATAVLRRFRLGLDYAAQFLVAWPQHSELPLPDPSDEFDAHLDAVIATLAPAFGDSLANRMLGGWCLLEQWLPPVLSLLQRGDVRAGLVDRVALTEAVAALVEPRPELGWVAGLLAVVDDDPLVVLHRATRRGYYVRITGVSDNFQLHTLLGGALIGDPASGFLPGTPLDPRWISAATDGPVDVQARAVVGPFNLVDVAGRWIWNEGAVADIPYVDGRRLVVLDNPPYQRSWSSGRQYPLMTARILVERVLTPSEAEHWLSRVKPAEERNAGAPAQ